MVSAVSLKRLLNERAGVPERQARTALIVIAVWVEHRSRLAGMIVGRLLRAEAQR